MGSQSCPCPKPGSASAYPHSTNSIDHHHLKQVNKLSLSDFDLQKLAGNKLNVLSCSPRSQPKQFLIPCGLQLRARIYKPHSLSLQPGPKRRLQQRVSQANTSSKRKRETQTQLNMSYGYGATATNSKFSDLLVYLSQQGSAGNRKYYINLL